MANVRGAALDKLQEAQKAAQEICDMKGEGTICRQDAQADANMKTVEALWAVFEYADAMELAGV